MQWAKATMLASLFWAQGLMYTTDVDAAFKEAKKTKKPVWVMVSATWCGPCRWTEKEVFPQRWFDSLIRVHFVPLKVYAGSGEQNTKGGEELAKKYQVRAYPTFLFLYPNGELFYRTEGTPMGKSGEDPSVREAWQAIVKNALSYQADLPTLRQKFEKGDRSEPVVRRYFVWAVSCGDSATLHKTWEAYIRAFPSPRLAWLYEPRAYEHLRDAALKLPAAFSYAVDVVADTLRNLLSSKEWEAMYRTLLRAGLLSRYQRILSQAKAQGLPEPHLIAAESTVVRAQELHARFPFAEKLALEMVIRPLFKARTPQSHAQALLYATQYAALIKTIGPPDPDERLDLADELNSLAWTIYEEVEEPQALWMAVYWAKEALSYNPDDWQIWDTLGALYYKLKRKKEAVETLAKAIALAQARNLPEESYQETQELLQKAQALE